MSAQSNARPIIIKRKKKGGGDGHHGGAWKVAYADFVTAMMAFFMLMWLLNATTEKQRKGIADYFSPTIPINRVSGGGDGNFGGNSVFSEETLPQNGTGATSARPTEGDRARGETGNDDLSGDQAAQDYAFETMQQELLGMGGESKVMENELEHIVTRITDEGLVIEVFSLPGAMIFDADTGRPTPLLRGLAALIVDSAQTVTNSVAIEGHVQAQPIVLADSTVWGQSMENATVMRRLLETAGLQSDRVQRVTGHADREPAVRNPMAIRNNRLEIIFLRE